MYLITLLSTNCNLLLHKSEINASRFVLFIICVPWICVAEECCMLCHVWLLITLTGMFVIIMMTETKLTLTHKIRYRF